MPWRATSVMMGLALVVVACGGGVADVTQPSTTQATATTPAPTSTQEATTSTTRAPTQAPGYSDYGEVEVERPDTTIAGASTADITIADFAYGEPAVVSAGQPVTVVNADRTSHTWTSNDGLFDSGTLAQGDEYTFTFDEPGEYSFHCTIHEIMGGSITVTE